jgi:hypothetical protein
MAKYARRVFFFHNFSDRANITFLILKVIPHVKYWWETFCEKEETKESSLFSVAPNKCSFRDVIKEQYYHVGSHHKLYREWTPLAVGKGPKGVRVNKCLPYIVHQARYQRN